MKGKENKSTINEKNISKILFTMQELYINDLQPKSIS